MSKILLVFFASLFFMSFISADSLSLTINYIVPVGDTPPELTNVDNKTAYNDVTFTFDIDATDDIGLDIFWINDTSTFVINSTDGVLTNSTTLSNGVYWLNVSVNDTIGQIDWEVFSITIIDRPTGGIAQIRMKFLYNHDTYIDSETGMDFSYNYNALSSSVIGRVNYER